MCIPVAAAATAMAVASSATQMVGAVGQYGADKAAADVEGQAAMIDYQAAEQDYLKDTQFWQQNVVNSWAAARDEGKQLLARELEEADALSAKERLSRLEEAEARALGVVSAASAGVSGASVDNLLADITRRSAGNREAERQSWRYTVSQIGAEKRAVVSRAQDRIARVAVPTPPNPAALGVRMQGVAIKKQAAGARLIGNLAKALPAVIPTGSSGGA